MSNRWQTAGQASQEVEGLEVEAAVLADASEAAADLRQGVFGEEDEASAGLLDLETVETRTVAGDGDGQVERQPTLAALGGAGDEAHGLLAPEEANEPGGGPSGFVECADASGGQRLGGSRGHDDRCFRAAATWLEATVLGAAGRRTGRALLPIVGERRSG
jgi:hypothetical protein